MWAQGILRKTYSCCVISGNHIFMGKTPWLILLALSLFFPLHRGKFTGILHLIFGTGLTVLYCVVPFPFPVLPCHINKMPHRLATETLKFPGGGILAEGNPPSPQTHWHRWWIKQGSNTHQYYCPVMTVECGGSMVLYSVVHWWVMTLLLQACDPLWQGEVR